MDAFAQCVRDHGVAGFYISQQYLAYSRCMRAHGAPFWPNPDPDTGRDGVYEYPITAHILAQEHGPSWNAALSACAKHTPGQLPFTEAQPQPDQLPAAPRGQPGQSQVSVGEAGMPLAVRAVMEADVLRIELTRNPRGGLTPAHEHGAAGTFSPETTRTIR